MILPRRGIILITCEFPFPTRGTSDNNPGDMETLTVPGPSEALVEAARIQLFLGTGGG
jgi:hypothetical protein